MKFLFLIVTVLRLRQEHTQIEKYYIVYNNKRIFLYSQSTCSSIPLQLFKVKRRFREELCSTFIRSPGIVSSSKECGHLELTLVQQAKSESNHRQKGKNFYQRNYVLQQSNIFISILYTVNLCVSFLQRGQCQILDTLNCP